MSSHAHFPQTAIAVGAFAIAVTAQADNASRPSAQDLLREPPPSSSAVIVVPVAPSRSAGGTVYYDDGTTLYGSDGSTATRYGDLIHVVPSADDYVDEVLKE